MQFSISQAETDQDGRKLLKQQPPLLVQETHIHQSYLDSDYKGSEDFVQQYDLPAV